MKNKLIVIGWRGIKHCYLNVDREEALKRWRDREGMDHATFVPPPYLVKEFEFEDEFGAYDAWQ